jgi:excisionase family DNA binding protein
MNIPFGHVSKLSTTMPARLSTAQAAKLLGVSARTILTWINEGELHGVWGVCRGRLGMRITRSALAAFAEGRGLTVKQVG